MPQSAAKRFCEEEKSKSPPMNSHCTNVSRENWMEQVCVLRPHRMYESCLMLMRHRHAIDKNVKSTHTADNSWVACASLLLHSLRFRFRERSVLMCIRPQTDGMWAVCVGVGAGRLGFSSFSSLAVFGWNTINYYSKQNHSFTCLSLDSHRTTSNALKCVSC